MVLKSLAAIAASTLLAAGATASVVPYTADANTLHLWHFDEASGPVEDFAGSYDLDNTGGATGRSGTTTGGYSATAYTGMGSAFSPLLAGSGTYHSSTSSIGGGVGVSTTGPATLASATGAFTWEALVKTSTMASGEYEIISRDGGTVRGGMFRILNGTLSLYSGATSVASAIPTSGDHAFVANEWFHAAVTYNGSEGAADNVRFYWTRLSANTTEANPLAAATLASDLADPTNNGFMIGGASRNPYRFELGYVDEVRISDRVRGADEFLFVVPEPASLGLVAIAASSWLLRRRA